ARETGAPALLHQRDEVVMNLALDQLEPLDFVCLFREERIEHRLALARRIDPALHTELLQEPGKSESAAEHPDRADDRGLIADDLIGRAGDHVAARSRNIFRECDDR